MGVDAVDVDNAIAIGTAADIVERYADVGVTENLLSTAGQPARADGGPVRADRQASADALRTQRVIVFVGTFSRKRP